MQIYIKICKLKQGCFEYYRKKTQETTPGATVHIMARIRNEKNEQWLRVRSVLRGMNGYCINLPGRSMFNDEFTCDLQIVWCNDLLCIIPIHVFAVANANDKNDKCIGEDFVYNSIVAGANSK